MTHLTNILIITSLFVSLVGSPKPTQSSLIVLLPDPMILNPATRQTTTVKLPGKLVSWNWHSVSHDGTRIIYGVKSSSPKSFLIWEARLDGSDSAGQNDRQVAEIPFPASQVRFEPFQWSYDDRYIAFRVNRSNQPYEEELVVVDVRTGQWQLVMENVLLFAWSPVKPELLVFGGGLQSSHGLYVVNPFKDTMRRLARRHADSVAWSPNGDRIAVVRLNSVSGNRITGSRDGLSLLHLSHEPLESTLIYTSASQLAWLNLEAWSPDGKTLLLVAYDNPILLDVNTHTERRLRDVLALGSHAVWSPDSRHIAYFIKAADSEQLDLIIYDTVTEERMPVLSIDRSDVPTLVWR